MTGRNIPTTAPAQEKVSIGRTAIIIAISIVVLGVLAFLILDAPNVNAETSISVFKDVFVDINGDGLIDYVRYAEVVVNAENFPVNP